MLNESSETTMSAERIYIHSVMIIAKHSGNDICTIRMDEWTDKTDTNSVNKNKLDHWIGFAQRSDRN